MKSLIELFERVLLEVGARCGTCTRRDIQTCLSRVECEGLSFLTITLPAYCRDFEQCLDNGQLEPNLFLGFKKRGGAPVFLRGLLSLIFDSGSGRLLDFPNIDAIQGIRQCCLIFQKIELPCSETRNRKAFESYVQCEKEVKSFVDSVSMESMNDFRRVSRLLFSSIFTQMDHDVYYGSMIPKHGPGSTAEGIRGNAKYVPRTWTTRLETYFPALDYLISSPRIWEDLQKVNFLEPEDEDPVKVILVPKTLKSPRIIAMEPVCMQYAQQALLRSFRIHCENDRVISSFLNLNSQIPNQESARLGSADMSLATLDLSEASDRVSNLHVQYLMSDWHHLDGAVQACRSRKADVPGYGEIPLSKFASMGSALTFPLEACVFLTCVFLGIEKSLGDRLSRKTIIDFLPTVRVFGDDIIVPIDHVSCVIDSLEAHGLKVNQHKSFWSGNFRESCGKEYFQGEDVTVTRLRKPLPLSHTEHPGETISLVKFRNHLYQRGYWTSARYCDRLVSRVLPYYPVVSETSPAIGRFSYLGYKADRVGGRYQSPLVRGYKTVSRLPSDKLDGDPAMVKVFLSMIHRGLQTSDDSDHLERSGRPLSVTLRRGWHSPF